VPQTYSLKAEQLMEHK